jgi:transcriptional regulator with XRE-family HTH domain
MWNEGARLLSRRRKENETIEDFGRRVLGVSRTFAGRVLSGDRPPGWQLRAHLLKEFGIDVDAWDKKIPHPAKSAA